MAAASAVGSVLGSIIQGGFNDQALGETLKTNRYMNDQTNKTNAAIARQNNNTSIQIARDNNNTSIGLQEMQNQFNRQQWEDTNQWNSPTNQMQLWRNAGLNPLSFNGGTPTSPVQQSSLPQLTMPNLQNPNMQSLIETPNTAIGDAIGNGIRDAIAAYNSTLKTESDVKKQDKETDWIDRLNEGAIKLNNCEITYKENLSNLTKDQAQLIRKTFDQVDQSINESKERVKKMQEEISNLALDGKLKSFDVEHQEKRFEQELEEGAARILNYKSAAEANKANAKQLRETIKQIRANVDYLNANTLNVKEDTQLKHQSYVHHIRIDELDIECKVLENDRIALDLKTGQKDFDERDLNRFLDIIKLVGALWAAKGAITTAKSAQGAVKQVEDKGVPMPQNIPNPNQFLP